MEITSMPIQQGKEARIPETNASTIIGQQSMDVSPNSSKTTLTKPCVIAKIPISTPPSVERIPTSPNT